MRAQGRGPALSSLRAAPATPTRRHPPERRLNRLCPSLRRLLERRSHRDSRQPHIRRYRRGSWRPQQARRSLKRKQPRYGHKDHPPSYRPTNPETGHAQLSP